MPSTPETEREKIIGETGKPMKKLGIYELGPNNKENGIYCGDLAVLGKEIPDESINLIHTDPPYPKEYSHVWYELGTLAARVLRPGGSLITLLGQYQLPLVMDALSTLTYRWIGWLVNKKKPTLFGYRIVCGGKPFLWYTKGKIKIEKGFWWDTKTSPAPDKRYHKWGQPVDYILNDIELLTKEGDVVFDPLCGGGTVAYACAVLDRQWLAFDIDPIAVEITRDRLRQVQKPLPILRAKQSEMEI